MAGHPVKTLWDLISAAPFTRNAIFDLTTLREPYRLLPEVILNQVVSEADRISAPAPTRPSTTTERQSPASLSARDHVLPPPFERPINNASGEPPASRLDAPVTHQLYPVEVVGRAAAVLGFPFPAPNVNTSPEIYAGHDVAPSTGYVSDHTNREPDDTNTEAYQEIFSPGYSGPEISESQGVALSLTGLHVFAIHPTPPGQYYCPSERYIAAMYDLFDQFASMVDIHSISDTFIVPDGIADGTLLDVIILPGSKPGICFSEIPSGWDLSMVRNMDVFRRQALLSMLGSDPGLRDAAYAHSRLVLASPHNVSSVRVLKYSDGPDSSLRLSSSLRLIQSGNETFQLRLHDAVESTFNDLQLNKCMNHQLVLENMDASVVSDTVIFLTLSAKVDIPLCIKSYSQLDCFILSV
ncbi:hypothetical protein B0H10DRAFT_2217526 [Mycena sp. CBHHK59/15]|nr:hypothetical protein B0H10DRAFT_2217526 [Mycena sp. CBHHK59/15]